MTTWDYDTLNASEATLVARLNHAGQDGWEAACMTENSDGEFTVILKRAIQA